VYGMRYFYRLLGLKDRLVELPVIKAKKKLPLFSIMKHVKRYSKLLRFLNKGFCLG
jgi:hypothetical protein